MKRIVLYLLLTVSIISCEKKGVRKDEDDLKKSFTSNYGSEKQPEKIVEEQLQFINDKKNDESRENDKPETVTTDLMEKKNFVKLEPINENETLLVEYDNGLSSYIVYKCLNGEKQVYYNMNEKSTNYYYISDDSKKVLYASNANRDYYYIDGNNGTIEFKGTVGKEIGGNFKPTRDFKYLVVASRRGDWPAIDVVDFGTLEVKYSKDWDIPIENPDMKGEKGSIFVLPYTKEILGSLTKKLEKEGLSIVVDEGDFDCILYLEGSETDVYGYGYFNAETGEFIKHMAKFYL